MSDIAIHIEKLSKQFHIGGPQQKYPTLRDKIADALVAPFRRAGKLLRGQATGAAELDEIIWALRDVSFDIKRGEVVGIIGRNGAGKSTLLKILSRITEPTTGFVDIYGRVSSLLEVGTGFHHELTGRENIYLNGAILGMKRVEIDRKFDEIVAFSEVEKFIDTPVKHYSSGMLVRLAFSVAAHLEPEILIIDEVLAVGDVRFQKKCLNKMEDVGQEGRTVLFVSHNMPAVARLCQRTILLDEGKVIIDGPSHQVVRAYLDTGSDTSAERVWSDPATAPTGEVARLRAVRVRMEDGPPTESIDIKQPIVVEMEYEVLKEGHVLLPHFRFLNEDGIHLFETLDLDPTWRQRPRPEGYYKGTVRIPGNFLAEGIVYVSCHLILPNPSIVQFSERQVIAFQVIDNMDGTTARGDWNGSMTGIVRPLLEWNTTFSSNGYEPEVISQHMSSSE